VRPRKALQSARPDGSLEIGKIGPVRLGESRLEKYQHQCQQSPLWTVYLTDTGEGLVDDALQTIWGTTDIMETAMVDNMPRAAAAPAPNNRGHLAS